MWIYDLVSATVATIATMILLVIVLRRYNKARNPPQTVQQKIQFFEELNEELRREMED